MLSCDAGNQRLTLPVHSEAKLTIGAAHWRLPSLHPLPVPPPGPADDRCSGGGGHTSPNLCLAHSHTYYVLSFVWWNGRDWEQDWRKSSFHICHWRISSSSNNDRVHCSQTCGLEICHGMNTHCWGHNAYLLVAIGWRYLLKRLCFRDPHSSVWCLSVNTTLPYADFHHSVTKVSLGLQPENVASAWIL